MNILVVQARMGSSRLPGKVMKMLGSDNLLHTLISRIKPSHKVDKIIVATTDKPEDDVIEMNCKEHDVVCFRGSESDVLDRYYQSVRHDHPETVIRLTADCPLNTFKVVDFAVKEYEKAGVDYFSNSNNEPEFLEDGFDVEVFSFKALETAWKEARLPSEREHVTPYIKNCGKFTCAWKKYMPDYANKLSVDTAEDFEVVQYLFSKLGHDPEFGMEEVVSLLKKDKHILEINKNSIPNAGYLKSLRNDKHTPQ
jgi:spore coat polysaccharide biosynthesis protein SpsF